jgi:ABC-type nitrate/sulfonate/bicarbonate transport system permease component
MTALRFYTPLFLILAVWQLAAVTGLIDAELLPSPVAIGGGLAHLLTAGDLALHVGVSIYRQMAGLILAAVIGVGLGIGMAHIAWMRDVFEPIVRITYPLPKSALIPLLILWFGIGHNSKIFAVFLGCLLPVVVSSFNGTRGVNTQIVWSARSLGTRGIRLLWKVYFFAALPEILSGMRIALALSYTLLVSSEFLIARAGLGFLIQSLGESGDYPGMFAGILIVALIGFTADRLYVTWMNWMLRWQIQT